MKEKKFRQRKQSVRKRLCISICIIIGMIVISGCSIGGVQIPNFETGTNAEAGSDTEMASDLQTASEKAEEGTEMQPVQMEASETDSDAENEQKELKQELDVSESETETQAPVSDQELVYWSVWEAGSAQAVSIQKCIDAYTEATGTSVHVEWKGQSISRLLKPALESGIHIDLFDEDFEQTAKKYRAHCLDLEALAAQYSYETYDRKILTQKMREWAGSLKAIPYQPYIAGIFYNKKLFKRADITELPENWLQLMDVCKTLANKNIIPLALDNSYVLFNYGFQLARYIGEDGIRQLCLNGGFDKNERVLRAAKNMQKLAEEQYIAKGAPGEYPKSENSIAQDQTAMILGPSWIPKEIEENTGKRTLWGFFPYPVLSAGKDDQSVTYMGAQAFAIPAYSQKQEEAFSLIMMLTSGEWDQKISLETKAIPADTRNTQWPAELKDCKSYIDTITDLYSWDMGLLEDENLSVILQKSLTRLFKNQITAEEFVKQIAEAE